MTAKEQIEAGHLTLAIEALSHTLRRDPGLVHARVSLFTLLGLSGEWDRALKHLDALESCSKGNALSNLDPAKARELVAAEQARRSFHEGGPLPQTLSEPGEAMRVEWEMRTLVAHGETRQASDRLHRFEEERSPVRGWLGGKPFEGFRDPDDLNGLILEVLAPGGYFWVEWDDVVTLDVLPPQSLLDLLWAQTRIHTKTGIIGAVVLPGLYPLTWKQPDELVRLGRRNDWIELGDGLIQGVGGKVYEVGDGFTALLELQDLVFDRPSQDEPTRPWP